MDNLQGSRVCKVGRWILKLEKVAGESGCHLQGLPRILPGIVAASQWIKHAENRIKKCHLSPLFPLRTSR
uniref:Uncharacterized protein n=1 Tax=Arundo donax TaxID=35708 RepID=A0A0A9HX09_ARUDO